MQGVTAAVTPKGVRRQYALVSAAAELLCEGGFDAVRHRAVARRAGLPLAATTYYFSSLDDLIVKAVEHVGALEAQQLRERLAGLSRRGVAAPRRPSTCWWICSSATTPCVGDNPETQVSEQLISRYERYIACARQPALREVQRRILQQRTDAVVKVVELCGRSVRAELVPALVCAVDGAVVAALVDDSDGPRSAARATLIDVIDVLAPITAPISIPRAHRSSRLTPVTARALLCSIAGAVRLMLVNDGVFTADRQGGPHREHRVMSTADTVDKRPELKRVMGPGLLLLFVVGDILGTGVYALTGDVAAEVGGAAWIPFLVAFLIATITAFSYLELVTKYPQAAGAALYAHKAFGIQFVTFLIAFVVMCSGITSASTASRFFAANFFEAFAHRLGYNGNRRRCFGFHAAAAHGEPAWGR